MGLNLLTIPPKGFGPIRVCSLLASHVSKLQIGLIEYITWKEIRTILISDKKVSENKTVRNFEASEIFTVQYKLFKVHLTPKYFFA